MNPAADRPPWVTYRMADLSQIDGEYAWVEDTEFFDDGDPCEVIEETWQLVSSRTIWLPRRPEPIEDDDE